MAKPKQDPRVLFLPIDSIVPYARNARTHSPEQVAQIAASIAEFGWTNPCLVDLEAGNALVAGHGRLSAARQLYDAGQSVRLPSGAEIDAGTVPVIDCSGWSEPKRRAYILADNQLAIKAGWDVQLLHLELEDLRLEGFDLSLTGFDLDELGRIGAYGSANEGLTDPDEVPEIVDQAITRPGDVWLLGRHRLMCGDSTLPEHVKTLLAGGCADLICTDPPYCSGGFQEAGKSSGSVGTSATHKMVANDMLSTRGYIAMLKTAFSLLGAPYLYTFTDWRMWVYLFDAAESAGFGARSMIVWDKGTPGMGRGWRAQHELVLWGCKQTPPFDKHASGAGNVLQSKRTGNIHHTTEKPVSIMVALLQNTPFVRTVADPFNGSGTTLIACEQIGKEYRGMELDALYVDVAVKRWQAFTGNKAILESSGAEFSG